MVSKGFAVRKTYRLGMENTFNQVQREAVTLQRKKVHLLAHRKQPYMKKNKINVKARAYQLVAGSCPDAKRCIYTTKHANNKPKSRLKPERVWPSRVYNERRAQFVNEPGQKTLDAQMRSNPEYAYILTRIRYYVDQGKTHEGRSGE